MQRFLLFDHVFSHVVQDGIRTRQELVVRAEMLVVLLHEMRLEGEHFGWLAEEKASNLGTNHSHQKGDLPSGSKLYMAGFVQEIFFLCNYIYK